MPRIVGIDIPKEKTIETALTHIHGIGRSSSNKILKYCGIDPHTRAKNLSSDEISRLAATIQRDYRIEGDLKRDVASNIKRLMEIGAYRGLRHRRGLPVRGQRTKTNARTRKGPRKTVGVMKTKEAKHATTEETKA